MRQNRVQSSAIQYLLHAMCVLTRTNERRGGARDLQTKRFTKLKVSVS